MDSDTGLFESTPVGSLIAFDEDKRLAYLEAVMALPVNLRSLLFSPKTGAYIRGLAREVRLTDEHVVRIAFSVLRVALGEISLVELKSVFSSELQIAGDTAEAMAKDIEKELFGPVMMELNQYLQSKQVPGQGGSVDMPNLLDLRGKAKSNDTNPG